MWVILLLGLVIPFRPLLGNGLIQLSSPIAVAEQSASKSAELAVTDTALSPAQDAKSPAAIREDGAGTAANKAEAAEPTKKKLPISTVLIAIWAIGATAFGAKHFIEYKRFKQIIKRWGKPVTDPYTLETFAFVKAKMGLEDKKIGLRIVGTITTPMLTGLFQPTILLPDKPIADDEMELILEHELTHYKHKDLLINLVGVLALCIHWFNPILYLCMPAVYGDGECYCDESVLKNKDLEYRRFYGEVIISMIEASSQKQIALSTCFYAKKINIKRRLFNIMESHGKRRKLSLSYLTLIMALTIVSGSVIVFASPGVLTDEPESASASTLDEKGLLSENRKAEKSGQQGAQTEPELLPSEANSDSVTPAIAPAPNLDKNAPASQQIEPPKQGILAEQAMALALANANLTAEQVKSLRVKKEANGRSYDVEFTANGIEYDYEIDAKTGSILKLDRESKAGGAASQSVNKKKEQNPNPSGDQGNAPAKENKVETPSGGGNKAGTDTKNTSPSGKTETGAKSDTNDRNDDDNDPDDKDDDVDHDIEEHDDNDSDHDND